MYVDSMIQYTICSEHNLPNDVIIQPDKSKSQYQLVCRSCADSFYGIVPAQLFKDQNKGLIQSFESQVQQNSNQLNVILYSLILIREVQNKKIESLIETIRKQIIYQDEIVKQCKQLIFQQEAIQELHENYIKNLNEFSNSAISEIKILQQHSNFTYNIQLLQELNADLNLNKIKRYEYQLLSTVSVEKECKSIACNKDASIVIAGFSNYIKVYQSQNEQQLKEIQYLKDEYIHYLKFLKMNNQFISLDFTSIKIWQQQYNSQWVCTQQQQYYKLITNYNFFVTNSNEDVIISTSTPKNFFDQAFWITFYKLNRNNQQWKEDLSISCFCEVFSLSLNESSTKLISSQKQWIQVYEYDGNKWKIGQNISVKQFGFRICFISESEFVFLPSCSEYLYLYGFNNKNKLFEIIGQFQIKNGEQDQKGFPIQFIQQKNLLIVKNCNFVNILRKLENNTFILDQSIEFETHYIDGCVSGDGQYLIILDNNLKRIQVKKLKMIF